jgi:N-acetyl-anhydromuramyl-L-alanine amidase AmpD
MAPVALSIIWLSCRSHSPPAVTQAELPEAGWAPANPSARWECIVIHHSASNIGGADRFDEWHRAKGWDELGYHFVVGNGTDTADGEVEVGSRWVTQKHGAHCKTPDEYYNQHGIGICLVGNFDNYEPSKAQIQSVVKLCQYLSKTFHIPPDRIFTHGGITGKTDCPGKMLDIGSIRQQVASSVRK